MPEGDEKRARRPHSFGDVAQQLDYDRRNPLSFQLRRYQAHGLVTHGSDGYQQCDINLTFEQSVRDLGCGVANQPPRSGDRPHEGNMFRTNQMDSSGFDEFSHAIDRKAEVRECIKVY